MQLPRFHIAVQGAAQGALNTPEVLEVAKKIGTEIATRDHITLIGHPSGFPLWAALGAVSTGTVIVFSPAKDADEHTEVYRLPDQYPGITIYTGLGKAGRNQVMSRTAHAVIFGPGGLDTIQEFTIALQENKIIGVLEGPWPTDECFAEILSAHPEYRDQVIFDTDHHRLLDQVIARLHN